FHPTQASGPSGGPKKSSRLTRATRASLPEGGRSLASLASPAGCKGMIPELGHQGCDGVGTRGPVAAKLFTPRAREVHVDDAPHSARVAFGRGREAAALLLMALAAYLVLALGSLRVDPNDPTVRGDDWVGPVGATIAE